MESTLARDDSALLKREQDGELPHSSVGGGLRRSAELARAQLRSIAEFAAW